MKTIELGHIKIEVDDIRTKKFYETQTGFTCDCSNCQNYVEDIPDIQNLLNGIDEKLGIDLTKDVGQGMDELMPNDYENYCLAVAPYYLIGKCFVNGEELKQEPSGPVWPNTELTKFDVSNNLSLLIINTSGDIKIDSAENILSIWLEYRTDLK